MRLLFVLNKFNSISIKLIVFDLKKEKNNWICK